MTFSFFQNFRFKKRTPAIRNDTASWQLTRNEAKVLEKEEKNKRPEEVEEEENAQAASAPGEVRESCRPWHFEAAGLSKAAARRGVAAVSTLARADSHCEGKPVARESNVHHYERVHGSKRAKQLRGEYDTRQLRRMRVGYV